MRIACKVYIEIFKEADCDYSCWGMNMTKKFDRFLQFNDITSLTLEYDDGSTEEIWVDYRGEHNEINDIQTTKKSSLGNLYIVISAENNFEDVFPDEYIEDKHYIEIQKEFNSWHMNDRRNNRGVGFFGLLGIAFIILKLLKVITWSWAWVLSPIWIPTIIGVILGLLAVYLKNKWGKYNRI